MRTRPFILSFVVHVTVIAAAMVGRIAATTELPDPPRSTAFIMATVEVPTVPPPAVRRQAPASASSEQAVPLAEPDAIVPDAIVPDATGLPDVVPSGGPIPGAGDVPVEWFGPRPAAPPAPRAAVPPPRQPLRVGGVVRPPQKIHHVAPVYPAIAQAARVSGTVILEALIGADGTVHELAMLKSVPLLDDSALKAVRQWRFTPTLLNGVPVPVIMTVSVTFTLN
jgi:protein TonB